MEQQKRQAGQSNYGPFVWWYGIVEDRMDPKKLGRLKVRIQLYHTENKTDIPTKDLFWAYPLQNFISAAMNGIGFSPTGPVEGTNVFGFFRDGNDAQDPVILGTVGGIPEDPADPSIGFNDPNGKYPKKDFLDEPDTNRLARNEKIDETVVQKKKDSLDRGVPISLGQGTFDEPVTPYDAKYPFNHVRETETGHIEEWDDTDKKERYHRYHRTGTFVEVHPDGKEVRKVVNDKYAITMGDDHLHVTGNVNITVDGNANIRVGGDSNIETMGNHNEHVHGNMKLLVGGTLQIRSGGRATINAPRIDLNSNVPGISF